ncbi:zinc finger protein 721-like [Lethenteron reissneri]|uniref:zinc finger protein 721-like n=1 Tax=Lethenteron reissneri TaxID=7753 RepID=UPI002AB72DBD|nr:zinc finger protein 721-like [Lethenteron reissneri]XP_061435164.1 zinc finger protein 721-like [Lethenteron reissneri]XP_061435165.1 zinc finger protein 721-like [Lethenteron reissneri]XP_061435166.1 zinc finger protein 721-like [Lethenteron reissneri]XP_061435167.1 zinc finger protein 721-like [Lethenteron reissneri]
MDIATAAGAAAAAARDPGREEEASLLIKEEREEESRPEVQAAVIVKCEEQEESVGSEVGGVDAGNAVEVSGDSRGERDASSQGWAEVEVELEDSDGDDGGGGVGGGRSKRQQHPCLDCGKTFVSIGGLRRHAQLHGIKRPCRERGQILTSDRDRRTRCQSHRQPRRPKSPTADGGRACPGRASAEGRRHLCGVCGRGFPWLCYLRSHERRHVLSGHRRRAVCAECGEVFSGQRELARHRQGHARGPLGQSASAQPGEGAGGGGAAAAEGTPATTLFLCDACDRAFPSHGELIEHRASHDGGERGSALPSPSKLSRRRKIRSGKLCRPHPRRHRRAGERASDRGERGRAFRRPSGLRRHRGRRPNARPDAPGAAEPTDAAGDGRRRDDGAGGAHVCGECGRGFRWPSYLKRHGRTHTGERPHMCGRCGKGFYQSSNLKKHLGIHDRERPDPEAPNGRGPPPWEESGEEAPPRSSHQGARGDVCGEERGRGSARAAELAAQRDGRPDVKTLGSPRPDEPLDREADEVPPRHESKRRAAALPAPDELPAGDGREGVSPTGAEGREAPGPGSESGGGGGGGAHVCTECGQGFRWLSYLTRHRRTHTGDRPHACAECGKGFSQPSDLRRHRRLHATERPGAAPASAASSEGAVSRPAVLEESEAPPPPAAAATPDGDDRRRDASRELVCTECGQAFACASSLNRHRRAHLGVRPHACAECDRAFLQASDLRRHQKVHGAGRPNARTRRPREPATRGGVVDAHRNEEPGVGGGAGGAFASGECVEGHGEERSGDSPLEREEPPKASIARQSEDPSRGRWCAGDKRGEPAVQPPGFVGESQAATQVGERSCSRGESASGEVVERLRALPSAEGPARARGDSIEASPANGEPERRPTSHVESRAHVCDDCGQEFRWLSYLKRHRRTHTGERLNVCSECGKAFYQPSDLTKHRRTHGTARPHVCGRCGRGFATPEKLAAHRGVHAGERPHVCPECGKAFAFADNLRKHAKIHARDKPPPCELCGRGFETFYRLSRHRKVHSGEYPHVCDECGEGFPCASHLRKHRWAHGGQKAHACGDCSKAFARASELKRHRRVHAGEDPRPAFAESRSSPQSSAAPAARPDEAPHGGGAAVAAAELPASAADAEKQRQHAHACDDCGQGFPFRSLLARHRRGAHGGTERRHACEECGRDFLRLSDLKKHARTHSSERPYACEVCGKGFVSGSRLRTHREIHSGERPYPCAVCGKRFAQPHGLGCHLKLHSGVRPHVCKECGEAFFWLSALKRHQMKHTGERPHVCQECGKGFTLVYRLKKHQKIHAAKLYLCDECGKGFTWHSSLRVHKRVHSREKPYVCEECGVRFAEPSNLKTHLRTHTGDRPYACEECGRRFSQSANLKRHRATHRPAPKAPAQQQQQRGDAAAPIAEAGMELGTCQ